MLWDGRRVPFTLLGGYLGAGKTTVLNHLLRHADGRRLAVLVNDVGAVNVDAFLVAEHDGETLALTNGCVCCAIADDLGLTLESIRRWDEPPDQVVMELSGVAEPARVAPWASTAGFRLDGIVVVADAEQVGDQVARSDVGDAVRAQLAAADVVVLSKTDLVADGGRDAEATVTAVTTAPIVVADRGVVEPALVLGVGRTAEPPERRPATMPRHAVELLALGAVTEAALRRIVDALDRDVVRAKGVVVCSDAPHPFEVHVVGRRRMVRPRPDLAEHEGDGSLVVVRR